MPQQRPLHNFPNGPINKCQICGSENLELVLDLRHQPLCDTLISHEALQKPEVSYPLRQYWCKDCTLSQLDYVVGGETVYHAEYPYRTGVTRELSSYLDEFAGSVISELNIEPDSLIVDIGSNDGTLLASFQKRAMRVLGVEPTGIARFAIDAGIETVQASFDEEVARRIVETHGKAKLVTATNVFAHMARLGDFVQGLETLVASDGFFVLENHYLLPVLERVQFDTIYHEHLRTYSLRSLMTLFDYYDFKLVDAKTASRYGGNIRAYVAKGKNYAVSQRASQLLREEAPLSRSESYVQFREKSIELKNELVSMCIRYAQAGIPVVGNSCPGRSSTLLNFAGIGPDLMPYITEQPASLKLGKYLPGTHIPIVNNQRLLDEQPEHVLLLAWHYAEPIAQQLRERGLRSALYVPMPALRRLDC